MVILHAYGVIKPEARERTLALLAAVTPPSRAEDACQSYVIYEAIDTPNTFVFVEQWASLDGLYAHFHTPHFQKLMAGLPDSPHRPTAMSAKRSRPKPSTRRLPLPALLDNGRRPTSGFHIAKAS